jgi:hypothetical protein
MRPFRPYDPQGPGQKDSRTIVHHRSLSSLVPLGLTPNDPIGGLGGNSTGLLAYDQLWVLWSQPERYIFPFAEIPAQNSPAVSIVQAVVRFSFRHAVTSGSLIICLKNASPRISE